MNAYSVKNKEQFSYQIIDTPSGLENAVKYLEREKTVAVDLEADSMYHYKEKVCLIQMATKKLNIVIDPLPIKDLSPLKPLFLDPEIKKVFHGADYDVRCLYRDFHIDINTLFDTQLACRFLGIKETGLEAVVRDKFNIGLDKKYQKKDWSKRPLPGEMIEYAARDAIYLVPLAEMLEMELEKKKRLFWVYEECDYLSRVRHVSSDNAPLFLKFKGAGRFRPRGLAILEALLQFRESVAEKRDKPVFRIFRNESLMKIAAARPISMKRLKKVNALSNKQIGMYGNGIVETINEALKIPENELPIYPRRQAPVFLPEVPRRIKALKNRRDNRANSLDIDPALLCNKVLMTAIATKNPQNARELDAIEEMKGWQKNVFGRDVVDVLRKMK